MTALGLTSTSFTGRDGDPSVDSLYPQAFGLAYQSLLRNLAHVVAFENTGYYTPLGGWDTHTQNVDRQINNGNRLWPSLGKLLTLMKNTPSPIVAGKTLFDTTYIWIQSEMGRTPNADPGMDATSSDGLGHWGHGSAMFIGGRFKRGIAVGGFTPDFAAMPFNLATGSTA